MINSVMLQVPMSCLKGPWGPNIPPGPYRISRRSNNNKNHSFTNSMYTYKITIMKTCFNCHIHSCALCSVHIGLERYFEIHKLVFLYWDFGKKWISNSIRFHLFICKTNLTLMAETGYSTLDGFRSNRRRSLGSETEQSRHL